MSTPDIKVENNDDANIDAKPPPKRRGRKRKSETTISNENVQKVVEPVRPEATLSRRGRPRKKVNYYDLANPENDIVYFPGDYFDLADEVNTAKTKKTLDSTPNHGVEPEQFVEQNSDGFESTDHNSRQENVADKSLDESQSSGIGQYSDTSGSRCSFNEKGKSFTEQVEVEGAAPNLDELSTSPSKMKDTRKYSYTGETVKMMNTLFSHFAHKEEKNSNDKDPCNISNGTNNTTNDSPVLAPSKRPYKRYKNQSFKEEDFDDGVGNVTCAICNKNFEKHMWPHHKQRYHNNLAWRVGDPPLDLNDQSFVMHTLNMLYKKKKPLYCDKCGECKKSVVGFLSHQSQCLKSEEQLQSVKVACELCGRKMLPVSLSTHMKFVHTNPTEKDSKPTEIDPVVEKTKNSSKVIPNKKRKAAKKALKIIENVTKTATDTNNEEQNFTSNLNFGSQEFCKEVLQKELEQNQVIECKFKCDFLATSLEEALKHFEECSERPSEGFACKKCLSVFTKLEEIIYHIELDHAANRSVEEESSVNDKTTTKLPLPPFLSSCPNVRKTDRVIFLDAFQWTYNFHEDNYSNLLFEDLRFDKSNWPLLQSSLAQIYLPAMDESCDVARVNITSFINPLNSDYDFKKYKLFESELHPDNKITIFCGGPVTAMAWLPTPCASMDENQVLVVSVVGTPDAKYLTTENYQEPSALQFWNFGRLRNKEPSMVKPVLAYGIAHDHGPVWHMEWCPSGCYNFNEEGKGRMGLLATTGSDSVVHIYAVPFFSESESGLYYKPKPVIKLHLQRSENSLLGGVNYYPTKISWSKASGHGYIAVGYTNGFVALFNLNCKSILLRYKDADNITCILPTKCFQAHSHSISALALYHLNGGGRWLMTGSLDRAVHIWDLENCSYPICTTKINIITDGFWFTNWMCYLVAADEGSTSKHVTTMLKQVHDYACDANMTLTFSPSTVSTISGSDWLNGMLHGNTAGELVALFPHQLHQISDHHKLFKSKRMLFGYTYLIQKDILPDQRVENEKTRNKVLQNILTKRASTGVKLSKIKPDYENHELFCNEPLTYDDAQEKYGLLFCDNKLETFNDLPKKTADQQLTAFSKSYGVTRPNQYPLTSVNKVLFNPNRQASLYYATGYQAGFVRISWMEFLKEDQQIK